MKKWSIDLPHITQKQKEIMRLIHKFRFLDRIQIQTIMKHKDYKRINVWLKDLVEKDYLFRIYERKIPLNIKPAIYFAAPTGIRFIRMFGDDETNHKLYREKERSEEFRNKCLLVANLYIDILQKTEKLSALNFFNTKQDFFEYYEMLTPYPDALISLNTSPSHIANYLEKEETSKTEIHTKKVQTEKKQEYLFFLELFGEKAPRYYLRYRVQQYIEYFDRHQSTELYPRALFVLPNELTKNFLVKFIRKTLEETLFDPHLIFFLTTVNQIQNKGIIGEIWTKTKE